MELKLPFAITALLFQSAVDGLTISQGNLSFLEARELDYIKLCNTLHYIFVKEDVHFVVISW